MLFLISPTPGRKEGSMEQTFTFQITALDSDRLLPQISRALEKRSELVSRQKCPKMWALTDRLRSVELVPQAVRQRRRRQREVLGLLAWALGLFALLPGSMAPGQLPSVLAAGICCCVVGTLCLWRGKRTLLGVLNLLSGGILCVGALIRFRELGRLLVPGLLLLAVGLAALLRRRRESVSPYDRAARQLLEGRAQGHTEGVRVAFSPEGMSILLGEHTHQVSRDAYAFFLETEDLLILFCHDTVTVLQKADLISGTIPQLRQLLSGQAHYLRMA